MMFIESEENKMSYGIYTQEGIKKGLIHITEDENVITYIHHNITRNYKNPEEKVQAEIFCKLVLWYIGLMEMQKKQYISEEFDEKLSRSRCRTGDVLVAIVGATLGRIGFIERDEQQGNINQNITKITISDLRFSPKFVAVFLDSKLGQIQLYRLSTKTAQSYLNNEQLGKVIIPTVCKSLQNDIVKAIEEAHQQAEKKKSEADEFTANLSTIPKKYGGIFKGSTELETR